MGCAASTAEGGETGDVAEGSAAQAREGAKQPSDAAGGKTATTSGPTVKMSKAQMLALEKRKQEEEEAVKKRRPDTIRHAKSSSSAPPPVRMTKAAQALADKKAEEKSAEERRSRGGLRAVASSSSVSSAGNPGGGSSASKGQSTSTAPATTAISRAPQPVAAIAADPVATLTPDQKGSHKTPSVLLSESELQGFQIMKLLGKGSFGSTYECGLRSMKIVCVKVIEFGGIADPKDIAALREEIAVMRRLHHPNIVEYYGCVEDAEKQTINIFMEYVTGGSMDRYIQRFSGGAEMATVRDWTRQIVEGVAYLHSQGIVHRDLKGGNILVDINGRLKLADFGCSKAIDETCSKTRGCATMVGTPYWMAPEVLKCEPYGTKADVWSLGCVVVEILTGKPAWPEMDNMWAAVYKIANSSGLPPNVPRDLPRSLRRFLEQCFERNPSKRASAAELLQAPWLNEKP